MGRWVGFLLISGLLLAMPAEAAETPSLARARELYNAGDYEGAIQAATPLQRDRATADAAALIMGRSQLERFRRGVDPGALDTARLALSVVRPDQLTPSEQTELLVGLGQALFLTDGFGAAAELFDTALGRAQGLADRDRAQLLDWWATALDRQAQSLPSARRSAVYDRIAARMEDVLRGEPGNGPANYWLAAASRGAGDPVRAWNAVVAGWVRATLNPAGVATIRADLDRLVGEALAVEVGRLRGGADPQESIAAVRGEWQLIKTQWP